MARRMLLARLARGSISASLVALGWAVLAGPVAAHGPVPTDPPSAANLLFGWTFPPLPHCRSEWEKRYPGWKWRNPDLKEWQPEGDDFDDFE